eukprot:CAMPEP_0113902564 /NCGR_PEP_ID=MMETSP0780_2-20120614/21921_1 /TAXON_ID=652834 /ORGANISM="Palpitomonas bilix" /LENGTH=299 /DNA_ID=CAMNT_0000895385 /DNA_START=348 /DNA_END=1247 /DNA_ORIENTATION=- /assembly_acc=CAM_ASM_000599
MRPSSSSPLASPLSAGAETATPTDVSSPHNGEVEEGKQRKGAKGQGDGKKKKKKKRDKKVPHSYPVQAGIVPLHDVHHDGPLSADGSGGKKKASLAPMSHPPPVQVNDDALSALEKHPTHSEAVPHLAPISTVSPSPDPNHYSRGMMKKTLENARKSRHNMEAQAKAAMELLEQHQRDQSGDRLAMQRKSIVDLYGGSSRPGGAGPAPPAGSENHGKLSHQHSNHHSHHHHQHKEKMIPQSTVTKYINAISKTAKAAKQGLVEMLAKQARRDVLRSAFAVWLLVHERGRREKERGGKES